MFNPNSYCLRWTIGSPNITCPLSLPFVRSSLALTGLESHVGQWLQCYGGLRTTPSTAWVQPCCCPDSAGPASVSSSTRRTLACFPWTLLLLASPLRALPLFSFSLLSPLRGKLTFLGKLKSSQRGMGLTAKGETALQSLKKLWSHLDHQVLTGFHLLSSLPVCSVYHELGPICIQCVEKVGDPLLVKVKPVLLIRHILSQGLSSPCIVQEVFDCETFNMGYTWDFDVFPLYILHWSRN
jgi:hypothetical protein